MRWFITLLSFVVLPWLPERHQRRWPWEPPASLGALAQVSAYANSIVAVVFWGTAFVLYQKTYGDQVSALIYQNGDVSYITWYGMVTFFSFFATPAGILLTLYLADSGVRLVHALGTGEPMGSLFLAAPIALWGVLSGTTLRLLMRLRCGPAGVPDRIVQAGNGLIVRASRPHDEWSDRVAFARDGRLYALHSAGWGREGSRRCYEYRLTPWPERATVRRVVELDGT
jgi:hypothetical protein